MDEVLFEEMVESIAAAAEAAKPKTHCHQCPECRLVWRHSDACQGNYAAHQCPGCGEPFVFWRYNPADGEEVFCQESF